MSTVRLNSQALNAKLRGPAGKPNRAAFAAATAIQARAKARVGKDTGALEASIVKRFFSSLTRFGTRVVATARHAEVHHEGSRPHEIRPRKARLLVFFWDRTGRVMFLPKVSHPGTPANPFLFDAARDLGLRVRRR